MLALPVMLAHLSEESIGGWQKSPFTSLTDPINVPINFQHAACLAR